MRIQDIESEIAAIGRIDRRLIRNPRFSDNPLEIDKAFARVFGAGLSDGHIDQFRVYCYAEADPDRLRIVHAHVRFFGEVDFTETMDENGLYDVRFSSVFGRLLEKRGFCVGDKTIQNPGVPNFILKGPLEVQTEYLKQLWAEDGSFTYISNSRVSFSWTRAIALYDPEKVMKYNLDTDFSQDLLAFVRDKGEYTEETSFQNRDKYPRYVLIRREMIKLTKDKNPSIASLAKKLRSYIEANLPKLMEHERRLLKAFGADTKPTWDAITFYEETNRVSVLWRIRSKSLDDAMKIAIMAPPDDKRKRSKVSYWIKADPARFRRIRNVLQSKKPSDVS
jgi:hypothetical protein